MGEWVVVREGFGGHVQADDEWELGRPRAESTPSMCAEVPACGGRPMCQERTRTGQVCQHRAPAERPEDSYWSRLTGFREPLKGFRPRAGMVQ